MRLNHLVTVILFLLVTTSIAITSEKDKWSHPADWPKVTTLDGIEVELRMYKRTRTDVQAIESAEEVFVNEGCFAKYVYLDNGREVLHGPAYSWKPDGRIEQKSYNFKGRIKYLYRYYPTGEVINSIVFDEDRNQIITNWYEKDGSVAGQYVANNKPACEMRESDNMHYWNGRRVPVEEYSKRIQHYMILSLQ